MLTPEPTPLPPPPGVAQPVVNRWTFAPKAALAAFLVKLVPFAFFMLWPNPDDNPFFAVNVIHTVFSFFFVAAILFTGPVWAALYMLCARYAKPGWDKNVLMFILYYIIFTPPMALFAFSMRNDFRFP